MDTKEIIKIVRKINEDNFNKWNCRCGKVISWFSPVIYIIADNRIEIQPTLIGRWNKLLKSGKYSDYKLEKYMKEYIRKIYFKNYKQIKIVFSVYGNSDSYNEYSNKLIHYEDKLK